VFFLIPKFSLQEISAMPLEQQLFSTRQGTSSSRDVPYFEKSGHCSFGSFVADIEFIE
jgi:hypothetical protein